MMAGLQSMLVPLGILGLLSLSAMWYYRMHLIAGAFWIIISLLSLSQWGLIYSAIGSVIGASHLMVMGRESNTRRSPA
jgi:hypothetical protein